MNQLNLQQAYSRQNWQNWLTEIFGSQIQFETQAENIDVDRENIKSIQRFASVKLADGKTLAVFDIETLAGVQISRNRAGLRNLVEKFIDHTRYHGILAFYHSDILAEYRMSFISGEPKIDDSGNFVIKQTSPKRYTYLLGKDSKTKTPADRLNIIVTKRGTAKLEDIAKAFSVETLTKEFYAELFAWYQWALSDEIGVTYPNDRSTEKDDRQIDEHLIRLITRLMFVWFIKQKNLVPETIFDIDKLKSILKNVNATDSEQDNYYRAILQNLFFATLNNKIEDRSFATDEAYPKSKVHYGIKTLYRYAEEFSISTEEVVKLFSKVPFLNGGLFECLDKDTPDSNGKIIYCDGFSRRKDRQSRAHIPNILFFDKDRGIIPLLGKYNFTIEENTPDDVNVALDPELLGKVFENLLGTYNPETKETARKQSGSFYTPREIVNYMVDESLIAYLKQVVGEQHEDIFRKLFNEKIKIDAMLKKQIYEALRNGKILDPACGSGAFPMGILNRIICIMENLDYSHSIFDLKLHLIENCIYGVDIQSIAVQISKLRFFISLICEQTPNKDVADNFGIKPLPNLETKFVAANILIGLNKKKEGDFTADLFEDPQIDVTKKSLLEIRHLHFSADTARKKKEYRSKDKELREKLATLLEANNDFAPEDAKQLALWNPYDQNASSPFFDKEWMFGLKEGFDIVIGNPPYLKEGRISKVLFEQYKNSPYYQGKMDLWYMFACYGIDHLKNNGHLCFIATNNWITSSGASKLRNKVISDTQIKQLIDFGNFMIFESASIQTMVMLFSKNNIIDNYNFDYRKLAGDTMLADSLDLLNKNTNNKAIYLFPKIVRNNLKDKFLTFSSSDAILDKMIKNGVCLTEKEVANGIHPHYDFVNKKNAELHNLKVGEGIFGLSDSEKTDLQLPENELNLIKPYYTTEQIQRYYSNPENKLWLIYTDSSFKNPRSMDNYPNLKRHLDKFVNVITSDNKPYGLHRTREERFFKGEKIVVQRKCAVEPSFSYSDFDCYVSATFYVIKSHRFNLKYLVGLLNSKLIAFWLRNKGKMQGSNYQLDKEPLLQIPIFNATTEQQQPIISLVNQILFLKNVNNFPVSNIVSNEIIASYFEKVVDACVYELYFEEEIKSAQVDVLKLIQQSLDKVSSLPIEQQILHMFEEWNDYKNEVRNRIMLQETRSESVVQIVKSANS